MLKNIPIVEDPAFADDLANAVNFARQLTILYHENPPLDRRGASTKNHVLSDFEAAYQMIVCSSSILLVIKELVLSKRCLKPTEPLDVDLDSELSLRQSQLQIINIVCDAFIVDCRNSIERRKWNIDRARGAHSDDKVDIPDVIMKRLDVSDSEAKMASLRSETSRATWADDCEIWTLSRVRKELKMPSAGLTELVLDDSQMRPAGKGAYGEVSIIRWKGSNLQVAMKRIVIERNAANPDDNLPHALRDLTRETLLWCELQHDNILRLLGFSTNLSHDFVDIVLISPYYEKGDLDKFLHSSEVPERKRLELVRDVARAIAYLHDETMRISGCIVHGDIRAANVLVSNTEKAVLCDFGIASGVDMDGKYSAKSNLTNIRWLAYELVIERKPKTTVASDIYAFGCLCFEIMHGKFPYFDHTKDVHVRIRKRRKEPPPTPYPARYRVQSLAHLMERCWDADPIRRPRARRLLEVLEYMINCI